MPTISEARALPFFTDLQGLPLESGFIYIGEPGLDPIAYPVTVSSDTGQTVVLQQPIRTMHGVAVSSGAPVHLFCPIPYSIKVLDAAGRAVYASMSETDPLFALQSTSTVQSESTLADLRVRAGSSTYQVWVTGYGMYIYDSTDTTSPESIPAVIVGTDGSRYKLAAQYAVGPYLKAQSAASPSSAGAYMSYNDGSEGAAYLTANEGSGAGGVVLRTVSVAGVETGRVSVTGAGALIAGSNIQAGGNVVASGGNVALNSGGTRSLAWDSANSRYSLPSAPLAVNGSLAITQASLSDAILANQQALGVGALALGNSTGPQPTLTGTWVQAGSNSNSVYLWVRTA